MAASSVTYFLKSLHARANREIEKGNKILFSAFVINNNISRKLIDKEPSDGMSRQINNMVKVEKPEIIKVDLFTENGQWVDGNVCDLRPKQIPSEPQQFQGLGEAQINALVSQRFEELKKNTDFNEMKDIVKELADENDELKKRVDELEEQNEELEEALESKKQVKYYAGMLGDILESIGIKKDKLRKPLAELMGLDDNEDKDEKKKLTSKEDNSGIVDENTTQSTTQEKNTNDTSQSQTLSEDEQKRSEIIALISQYLTNVNNQLLGEIFNIFSEIESDKTLAPNIIEYIAKLKEFAS
ncbi:MAG: hypothetical protein HY840_06950 [Bacteroidetes bacterium]|nr:hypothetical protein [Bacteroidota bacterium]